MRKILVKGWHIEMRSDDAYAAGKVEHRGIKKTGGYYRIVVHG